MENTRVTNELITEASKVSCQMKHVFPGIPFEELLSETIIYILNYRKNRLDMNSALEYSSARWKLFDYGKMHIKEYKKYVILDDPDDIIRMKDEDGISYNEYLRSSEIKETIMKIDMQLNLSEDALYVMAGILSYKFLEKGDIEYKLSKKNIVIENLKREGWKWNRAKEAIDEITIWWRKYFKGEIDD
jgi:hypothetical protein